MALNFNFDPSQYEEHRILPEGDYRVRISDIEEKQFKSGNEGYEITLAVNGSNNFLWAYLVVDTTDLKKTNQRFGAFFDSFGITNTNSTAYKTWIGKVGAARVKHEDYNGDKTAKVAYFIAKAKQNKLPAWSTPIAPAIESQPINDEDLPF